MASGVLVPVRIRADFIVNITKDENMTIEEHQQLALQEFIDLMEQAPSSLHLLKAEDIEIEHSDFYSNID